MDVLDDDDFIRIVDFNKLPVLSFLGNAVSEQCEAVLFDIGREMRKIYKKEITQQLEKSVDSLYNTNTGFSTLKRETKENTTKGGQENGVDVLPQGRLCLFRNPTYTGAAANGSRQIIAENCHEPYITKEQFYAFPCNMREGENKISIRKSYKKPNPLAKHIVCTCGRALCWHKDKKTGEELFYCRYCRAHRENGKNLKVLAATIYKNVMDALELEHLEEEKLAAVIQQGAGKKAIEGVRAERSIQMKSVLAELNMEQFRRVPLYESYMANEITEEQYHAELMDYEEAHNMGNKTAGKRTL